MAGGPQAWLAVAAPGLLPFSWATLLLAHYWNRTRQHGGGLPWVLGILWASTWILAANTIIFGLSRTMGGGGWEHLGLSWKPLVQGALTGTYLGLLAADVALAAGWWRLDLAGLSGRWLGARRWRAYAVGHMANLAVGLALAAAIATIVSSVG
ncbi:MAG: hypothetical protein ACE5IZ_05285 [Dehalococcoidia bacterium]